MHAVTLESVTDDAFAADVLESDRPVVVDFTASWCAPCRVMTPVLEELAAERDDLRFVQLDIDANPATASRYDVMAAPTFVVFDGGEPVLRLVGSRPKRRFAEELAAVV